jgi:replicative DNA helicase
MSFGLGLRVIKSLCDSQNTLEWQKAKLNPAMFKANEIEAFEFVQHHLVKYHVLPKMETLIAAFPDVEPLNIPEPPSYYVSKIENRFFYDRIGAANLASQEVLKKDDDAHEEALKILTTAAAEITAQKYRLRIMDVGEEAPQAVLQAYHKAGNLGNGVIFGWPYLDHQTGGVMPGEVVSYVGRPAAGKTWKVVWGAIKNWRDMHENVLIASMEMQPLPMAQRITAITTSTPIGQQKMSGFSSATLKKFYDGLKELKTEKAKMYIVDGNLAASVEDIFLLADMLKCRVVYVDGAYLLRHKNTRLDRFTRAAENVELIKRYTSDLNMSAFCSWQFNRVASQKQKKGTEQGDLEDIGYSDAIGQISSIVLGLFQEDSVETLKERKIRILKGRSGEVGQFSIGWDFMNMDFSQTFPTLVGDKEETSQLEWL